MSTTPRHDAEGRAAKRALPARRRTPTVWIGIAAAIAAVFAIVFTLAWAL
jgi:hypothetical protein